MSGDHSQLAGMICMYNCSSRNLTLFWTNNNYDERQLRVSVRYEAMNMINLGHFGLKSRTRRLTMLTDVFHGISYRKMSPHQKGSAANFENSCPSATLSTTNPTWPDPGSNPGRRDGKPATNRLSYGGALVLYVTKPKGTSMLKLRARHKFNRKESIDTSIGDCNSETWSKFSRAPLEYTSFQCWTHEGCSYWLRVRTLFCCCRYSVTNTPFNKMVRHIFSNVNNHGHWRFTYKSYPLYLTTCSFLAHVIDSSVK
jgi:hypothetical protein